MAGLARMAPALVVAFIALLVFLSFWMRTRAQNRRKQLNQLRTEAASLRAENAELLKFLQDMRTAAELYRGDHEVNQILTMLDASPILNRSYDEGNR